PPHAPAPDRPHAPAPTRARHAPPATPMPTPPTPTSALRTSHRSRRLPRHSRQRDATAPPSPDDEPPSTHETRHRRPATTGRRRAPARHLDRAPTVPAPQPARRHEGNSRPAP